MEYFNGILSKIGPSGRRIARGIVPSVACSHEVILSKAASIRRSQTQRSSGASEVSLFSMKATQAATMSAWWASESGDAGGCVSGRGMRRAGRVVSKLVPGATHFMLFTSRFDRFKPRQGRPHRCLGHARTLSCHRESGCGQPDQPWHPELGDPLVPGHKPPGEDVPVVGRPRHGTAPIEPSARSLAARVAGSSTARRGRAIVVEFLDPDSSQWRCGREDLAVGDCGGRGSPAVRRRRTSSLGAAVSRLPASCHWRTDLGSAGKQAT